MNKYINEMKYFTPLLSPSAFKMSIFPPVELPNEICCRHTIQECGVLLCFGFDRFADEFAVICCLPYVECVQLNKEDSTFTKDISSLFSLQEHFQHTSVMV